MPFTVKGSDNPVSLKYYFNQFYFSLKNPLLWFAHLMLPSDASASSLALRLDWNTNFSNCVFFAVSDKFSTDKIFSWKKNQNCFLQDEIYIEKMENLSFLNEFMVSLEKHVTQLVESKCKEKFHHLQRDKTVIILHGILRA